MPDRLDAALDHLERVLPRVEKLARDNRRQRVMLAVLAVVVAVLTVITVIGSVALHDLHDLTARQHADTVAASLNACRIRNAASRGNRDRFAHFYDALDSLFPSPQGKQFVADLRAAAPIPDPKDEDIDCNADGTLDASDYPAP
jgi:hypothetical protein